MMRASNKRASNKAESNRETVAEPGRGTVEGKRIQDGRGGRHNLDFSLSLFLSFPGIFLLFLWCRYFQLPLFSLFLLITSFLLFCSLVFAS